jgi:hypothetical protein
MKHLFLFSLIALLLFSKKGSSQEHQPFNKELDTVYIRSIKNFSLHPNQNVYNRTPGQLDMITIDNLVDPEVIELKKDSLLGDVRLILRHLIDSVESTTPTKRYTIIYTNRRHIDGKWVVFEIDSVQPHSAVVHDISDNYPTHIGDSALYTPQFKTWLANFTLPGNLALNPVFEDDGKKMVLKILDYLDPEIINTRLDSLYERTRTICARIVNEVSFIQPNFYKVKYYFIDKYGLQPVFASEMEVIRKRDFEIKALLPEDVTQRN